MVSRRTSAPEGRVMFTQSLMFARGLSPVPLGLISSVSGRTKGSMASSRGSMEPSTWWKTGMGSPQ
ncbi:hypothetical protein D3C86_1260700 [compost metagenome]